MPRIQDLHIKLFADGADRESMVELSRNPLIQGFTTNPTLMRRAGVPEYRAFAREMVRAIPDRPISFEVLADDFQQMEEQARQIASWGEQVYVKIPITNTRGDSSCALVERLTHSGVKVNVTAILALHQVRDVARVVQDGGPCFVSVFAGRVADTGRDPVPLMAAAAELLQPCPSAQLLWGSCREVLNIFQANAAGCDVITVTPDLLKKLDTVGRDLDEYSRDTVAMFYRDAQAAGYSL